jgi:hypothetical protein
VNWGGIGVKWGGTGVDEGVRVELCGCGRRCVNAHTIMYDDM